jgi:hypothetical protein
MESVASKECQRVFIALLRNEVKATSNLYPFFDNKRPALIASLFPTSLKGQSYLNKRIYFEKMQRMKQN